VEDKGGGVEGWKEVWKIVGERVRKRLEKGGKRNGVGSARSGGKKVGERGKKMIVNQPSPALLARLFSIAAGP